MDSNGYHRFTSLFKAGPIFNLRGVSTGSSHWLIEECRATKKLTGLLKEKSRKSVYADNKQLTGSSCFPRIMWHWLWDLFLFYFTYLSYLNWFYFLSLLCKEIFNIYIKKLSIHVRHWKIHTVAIISVLNRAFF